MIRLRLAIVILEPTEDLRRSAERQDERYRDVIYWTEDHNKGVTPGYERDPGWYGMCCDGCHGCCGLPVTGKHLRPIDAYLALLEWEGKVPVGPTRVVEQ